MIPVFFFRLRVLLLLVLLAGGGLLLPSGWPAGPASASAQEVTPEVRADFARLVRERSQAHAQLQALDRQAADRLREGRSATEIFAEQQNTQDRLDLVQLRLEVLATRYGLPLQSVEAASSVEAQDKVKSATDQAFAIGEARARARLEQDMKDFLASVDFSDFLAE